MSNNWDNEGVLYLNDKSYSLSNINFNVTKNSFDSRIDRIKLFAFSNSSLDSVEINNHLFKKIDGIFYEVIFEKDGSYLLKKHDIKVTKGAINRLDLSEGKSFTSLIYKYLIKSDNKFRKFDLNKRSIVDLIDDVILNFQNESKIEAVKKEVNNMMQGLPLFAM